LLERIIEILTQVNILNGNEKLHPITTGQSCAYVYSVEDKYVIKYYSHLSELDLITRMMCRKEYDFYEICSHNNIDFIPEVVFQTANDDEVLILMKKYAPIKNEEWTENLQKRAVEVCAQINALDTADFNELFLKYEKLKEKLNKIVGYKSDGTPIFKDEYPLSLSYQNWKNLQEKFSEHIDASLLKEMYDNFDKRVSSIPKTLCHGDWNPNSCLKNGDKLLVCDWAEVGMGKGIDSVIWFIKSGERRGINMNRNKLIDEYCKALFKYANIQIDINDLNKHFAASDFSVAFTFGAEHIQNADIDSVLNIYNTMANNYKLMITR
jgi:hypothetical protein